MAEKNKDKQSTVNENINWNTVEDFNDMFDIVDDENDTLEYAEDELNKYYLSGHVNSMVQEDEMIDDDSYDNDINVIEEIQTEAILSQNFSQLSTKAEDEQKSGVINKRQRSSTTISSPDASCKKIKLIVDDADESTATTTMSSTETNEIPIYLSINNKLFVHMAQTITKTTNSISINSIQQLALFIHQAASVRTDREVMKAYLHSVMGTLKQSESHLIEVDRRVWPIHVQSLMLTQHKAATTTACASVTEDQQADCEKHLHQRLIEMNEKIQYHQNQFNEKKNNLIDFTSNIEQTIRSFVQKHGVKPLEMKRNLKIAMTNHDYDSEILRRQYLQEKPNEYQIQVMKHLSEKKRELEKSKRELLEMKYRVFYNKPHSSLDAIETTMPILNDDDRKLKLLNKHEKLIQRKKLDFVAIKIIGAEIKFYQCLRAFDHELAAMWKNHRELVKNKGMSTTLTDLIEKRFTGIADRWRDVYNYRLNCYFRNFYSDFEPTNTNADGDKMKRIGFSSSLIIDAIHQLSDKELQLLNRGPSYVPPGQISISSSGQSVDDIIKKKYAPLKHQLSCLFSKYHVNIALSMEIEQKISDQFTDLFSVPIPSNLQQRALYEKHLLQSIRYSLNANNLILRRTADNMNTFYLGNLQEFETKAYDYLSKSDAYKVLLNKDKGNSGQQWQGQLKEMVESMNLLLESLKNHKAINIDLFNRLLVDASKKLIASNVPFLNAFVQNQNGNLFSRIYRHPLIQDYSLSYEVGHAKLVHSDWLRSALIRAVCYCSSVKDFNLERIYLELTSLINSYSLRFVETHVQHFFNFFHLHPMRYSRDQIMYNKFRHNWFNYIKMQHELSDQLQQFDDKGQLIHLNYLYEYGTRYQFNEQFHRIWSEYFNQHPNLSIQKCKILLKAINVHS
ncbi:unnamed protein product [Rotaria magnacalcarata]|uniref:Helix-turn-helix domain-containing protein n=2 Tax=Rotaria magnacalcarata TaxID=392030 RepID=A0A816Z6G6_9BILA|nr:unnamed protein product [Rotaria magnacalcarata]